MNRVTETAGAAHFVTAANDDDTHLLLFSNRRTDGVILDGLIEARPASDLIPKLVQGLMDHRTRGRWGNTQENAFILLALQRYFETYEADDPDFVARAWLGQRQAAESTFAGRSADRRHVSIPMDALAEAVGDEAVGDEGGDETADVILAKDGPGRLYYRLGLRYAPADLFLAPREAGFAVERRYEAVDDPADVQLLEDGTDESTWLIRRGATVRVRVTLVAPASRSHVALIDPLPAGFEPLNPALAVTGSLPASGPDPDSSLRGGRSSFSGWWWRHWFEHQNLRDDRVEVFASRLGAGVYSYEYVARATTPGVFVAPPARVEEMYAPETFGRGATARVVVE